MAHGKPGLELPFRSDTQNGTETIKHYCHYMESILLCESPRFAAKDRKWYKVISLAFILPDHPTGRRCPASDSPRFLARHLARYGLISVTRNNRAGSTARRWQGAATCCSGSMRSSRGGGPIQPSDRAPTTAAVLAAVMAALAECAQAPAVGVSAVADGDPADLAAMESCGTDMSGAHRSGIRDAPAIRWSAPNGRRAPRLFPASPGRVTLTG